MRQRERNMIPELRRISNTQADILHTELLTIVQDRERKGKKRKWEKKRRTRERGKGDREKRDRKSW